MKRLVLFFFILAASALLGLPGAKQQAAQETEQSSESSTQGSQGSQGRLIPREALIKRRMMNPHEGFLNRTDPVAELSRATQDVASKLPVEQSERKRDRTLSARPQSEGFDNLIDKEIFATLASRGVDPAQPASDEEFC